MPFPTLAKPPGSQEWKRSSLNLSFKSHMRLWCWPLVQTWQKALDCGGSCQVHLEVKSCREASWPDSKAFWEFSTFFTTQRLFKDYWDSLLLCGLNDSVFVPYTALLLEFSRVGVTRVKPGSIDWRLCNARNLTLGPLYAKCSTFQACELSSKVLFNHFYKH